MKKLVLLFCLIFCIGCVSTRYHKQVTVQKDAKGKIQSITVVEEITQPNRVEESWPFKYLKE